jgi:DNA-binding MarR family transcriptional regulator
MPDAATNVSQDEWAVWRALFSMRRELDLALERQLQRAADISAADYGVLLSLFDAPGKQLRARELGVHLAWEKSRVSHQVSRMEKRGLVERRMCDSDARGTWVGITPDGTRAVLGAMRDHAATLRQHFFDVLTDDELQTLRTASERVLATIDPVTMEPGAIDSAECDNIDSVACDNDE